MDDQRFDALARALAAGASRRGALRLLAAGVLGGWRSRGGVAAAGVDPQRCDPGMTKCLDGSPFGICVDTLTDPNNCGSCGNVCFLGPCSGGVCQTFTIPIPPTFPECFPQILCGDVCVDGSVEPNCGGCGIVCAYPTSCVNGACVSIVTCDPGFVSCNGVCIDLLTNPGHCGACGNACPSEQCAGGVCTESILEPPVIVDPPDCAAPEFACGDICVDLATDPNNCGECGSPCTPPDICGSGVCVSIPLECAPGLTYCSQSVVTQMGAQTEGSAEQDCVDLRTDPFHCGACFAACMDAPCVDGVCGGGDPECDAGLTACPAGEATTCVDLQTDVNNCGGCGDVCAGAGLVCVGGECACAAGLRECDGYCAATCTDPPDVCDPDAPGDGGCGPGLGCCGGDGQTTCRDLRDDPRHCGACGLACAADEVCVGGECVSVQPCGEGFILCEGDICLDPSTTPFHCGACGVACAADEVCIGGACKPEEQPCRTGTERCGNACINLATSADHCGDCGNACADDEVCQNGACVVGVEKCRPGLTRCDEVCVNTATNPLNCGACGLSCAVGATCRAGICQSPPTVRPTVPTNPPTGPSSLPPRRTSPPSSEQSPARQTTPAQRTSSRQFPAGPVGRIGWPFDPEDGRWAILNGYRGEAGHAPRSDGGPNPFLYAFALAKCEPDAVDEADGVCDLPGGGALYGARADRAGWDARATRGATVLSPVDGTVAWVDKSSPSCLALGIAIDGEPGHRLALFHVEDYPTSGRVTRGEPIGRVAAGGCGPGDQLEMLLYTPERGSPDDPPAGRVGVPFTGDWEIAGCDYPDDRRTANQHLGALAPCTSPGR